MRIGILGLGFMGTIHYGNLVTKQDVDVVVCDKDRSKCEKVVSDKTKVFTDFDVMINTVDLDALFICLPLFAHNDEFEKAVDKGIAVFIEKPIALSEEKAKTMFDLAMREKVVTQVGYHQRFGYAVSYLKELIDSGRAGKKCMFIGHYACNALHAPWWREKEKSGGQIQEQVIHTFDMAYYLFGKVDAVSGVSRNICHNNVPNYTIEDVSATWLSFSNDAIGSITASNCSIPGRWDNPFHVICENVVADFKNPNEASFFFTKENKTEIVSKDTNLYALEAEIFLQCVKNHDLATRSTITDGYEGLKIVTAVKKSTENKGEKVIIRL